jgi:hypothetical protein
MSLEEASQEFIKRLLAISLPDGAMDGITAPAYQRPLLALAHFVRERRSTFDKKRIDALLDCLNEKTGLPYLLGEAAAGASSKRLPELLQYENKNIFALLEQEAETIAGGRQEKLEKPESIGPKNQATPPAVDSELPPKKEVFLTNQDRIIAKEAGEWKAGSADTAYIRRMAREGYPEVKIARSEGGNAYEAAKRKEAEAYLQLATDIRQAFDDTLGRDIQPHRAGGRGAA